MLDIEVSIWIMAALVAAQALGFTIFFFWLAHKIDSQQQRIDQTTRTVTQRLQQLEKNLDKLTVIREKLPEAAAAASRQLTRIADHADRLDRQLEGNIRSARHWVAGADRRMEAELLQFQRQTGRVQKLVRHPAIRTSAITKAGLAFLTQLLAPSEEPPRASDPGGDDEIFI